MIRRIEIRGAAAAIFEPRPWMLRPRADNDNERPTVVRTVTVRIQLEKTGLVVKVKVPVDEFVGVAVSSAISTEGVLTSRIELAHADPHLNYVVYEEVGNANVVAEWQNWARKLRLPLF